MTLTDNVSILLSTTDACGILSLTDVVETTNLISDLTKIVTNSGDDNSGITITIYSSDYFLINSSGYLSFDFSFKSEILNKDYPKLVENVKIPLVWIDPCTVKLSWIILNDFEDSFEHDVIVDTADTTVVDVTYYRTKDCNSICGNLVATLTYPKGSPDSLNTVIVATDDSISVLPTASYEFFGTYDMEYNVGYENSGFLGCDASDF
jgi:hypothetical protein